MASVAEHIQESALSKYAPLDHNGMRISWTDLSDNDNPRYSYQDTVIIMDNDRFWAVKDILGRDIIPGRFTTVSLAKEFVDRHIKKQQEIELKKQIEREENERTEYDKGNT